MLGKRASTISLTRVLAFKIAFSLAFAWKTRINNIVDARFPSESQTKYDVDCQKAGQRNSWIDVELVVDRCWVDVGLNSDRCWIDDDRFRIDVG